MQRYVNLKTDENDCKDFILIICQIINNYCNSYTPSALSGIKIKNWFDHKWLNYSGKGIVPFITEINKYNSALKNFWKDKITIPPFHKNRVLSEINYKQENIKNDPMDKILHKPRISNLNNRLENYSKDAIIFWHSSDSDSSKKGSLMIYHIKNNEIITFYISFHYKEKWKIEKTKNISVKEVELFI